MRILNKKSKKEDPNREIIKKLDILIAILLAQQGLEQKEIAKILRKSEKTVQRMFPIPWHKIHGKESR